MADDILHLSEIRKQWVEANRANGFEMGIKRLLTELYPDNAHFIYELLQNAEDARASVVRFILANDRVEFEHNGDRLFSIEDVNSITSIGVSTKKDDPTSIGKFGVGFKAVFAYTNTPEVNSGEFHFRIIDMVVPEIVQAPENGLGKSCTRFVFPFDNPKKSKEDACNEIERHLRQLGENTLLFLRNVSTIEYLLPNSTLGFLKRDPKEGHLIEIAVQRPDVTTPSSTHFLRFDKEVELKDDNGEIKTCRIAVAFGMEQGEAPDVDRQEKPGKRPLLPPWRVRPLTPGQVSIYFPAEKETSNLRFHLHAPFASTVARDSVRFCPANGVLMNHLAELVSESMSTIRDQGLLTMGFLEVLPNDKDNLPWFYRPILDDLIKAFRNESLAPMKIGGHAAAKGIYRGSAQLSNLINDEDLAMLLAGSGHPPLWVANPPQRNQRADNFLSILNIGEWTTEHLVNVLSTKSERIMQWLLGQSAEWHQQLYVLLGDYVTDPPQAFTRRNQLSGLAIVRLSNGSYSVGSKCYFPSEGVENDELMPRVWKDVYTWSKNEDQNKKSRDFLAKIGVREVGELEQVEVILNDRYSQGAIDRGAFKPDLRDLHLFVSLVEKQPSRATLFANYVIFKLSDGIRWGTPAQVYLDAPFRDTGLAPYYEALGAKAPRRSLSREYEKCGLDLNLIGEFAAKAGAATALDVGLDSNNTWLVKDFTIKYIDEILPLKNIGISRLLWRTLISNEIAISGILPQYLTKQSRKDGRCRFRDAGASSIITKLTQHAWVPQCNPVSDHITFVKPADADSRLLPSGFPLDKAWKWVDAVKLGEALLQKEESERLQALRRTAEYQSTTKVLKTLGFDSIAEAQEMADLKRRDPEGYRKWLAATQGKPTFPKRKATDPQRRQERLEKQIAAAAEKLYEERIQSVRTTQNSIDSTTWLRNLYTNDAQQMVCQICANEMPFKKRDGEYYFESVEALSNEYFTDELEAQYLALCPTCAAKFKVLVKQDDSAMQNLHQALKNSEEPCVAVLLGDEKASIQFVETHWQDIKAIIQWAELKGNAI